MKMKLPNTDIFTKEESSHNSVGLNTFGLLSVSLLWGHMLSLVSWWWLPVTVLLALVGYGTEISKRKEPINVKFK
jgi:hypothetical protein